MESCEQSYEKEYENFIEMVPEEYQQMYRRLKSVTQVLTKDAEPEVGPTPKEVIWTRNKTKLYRYISEHPKNIKLRFS